MCNVVDTDIEVKDRLGISIDTLIFSYTGHKRPYSPSYELEGRVDSAPNL